MKASPPRPMTAQNGPDESGLSKPTRQKRAIYSILDAHFHIDEHQGLCIRLSGNPDQQDALSVPLAVPFPCKARTSHHKGLPIFSQDFFTVDKGAELPV